MRTATGRDDEDRVAILGEFLHPAGVAELADARDSKSRDLHWSWGFDPHLQHQGMLLNTLRKNDNVAGGVEHAYSDQSHMIAESRRLSGRTPAQRTNWSTNASPNPTST